MLPFLNVSYRKLNNQSQQQEHTLRRVRLVITSATCLHLGYVISANMLDMGLKLANEEALQMHKESLMSAPTVTGEKLEEETSLFHLSLQVLL